MKIIQVVPDIALEASGPSYSVRRLCESLKSLGEEVQLTTLDWAPMNPSPNYRMTFPLGFGPRRLGRSPAMKRWLYEHAISARIIHNHGLWMMPSIYAGNAARKCKIPMVVSPRGTLSNWAMRSGSISKRLFWPLIQRPVLERAQCFHATAVSECQDIRRMGFRQPIAMIPNGIDLPEWKPKETGTNRTLLFLGRINPVKGLDLLLPAWKAVQDRFPDWQLTIAGPDSSGYSSQVQTLAANLELKRVSFVGPLYGVEKTKAYRDANLFVLPSYSENFAVAVAEALAAGTPAIVSKGAPWQGLESHNAGWWVDIGTAPLVTCLEKALSSKRECLDAMGQRGRNWMESEYAWSSIGRQMAETYRWILGEGDRPAYILQT